MSAQGEKVREVKRMYARVLAADDPLVVLASDYDHLAEQVRRLREALTSARIELAALISTTALGNQRKVGADDVRVSDDNESDLDCIACAYNFLRAASNEESV